MESQRVRDPRVRVRDQAQPQVYMLVKMMRKMVMMPQTQPQLLPGPSLRKDSTAWKRRKMMVMMPQTQPQLQPVPSLRKDTMESQRVRDPRVRVRDQAQPQVYMLVKMMRKMVMMPQTQPQLLPVPSLRKDSRA